GRRDRRADRAERRGQVHLLQHADGPARAGRRRHPHPRAGDGGHADPAHLAPRRRADLPGHRHLRLDDRARERPGRVAVASARPARLLARRARTLRRGGGRAARDGGHAGARRAALLHPRLRRPEATRTRRGPCQRTASPADGRADGRDGPARADRPHGADRLDRAPGGHGGAVHGARHGRGVPACRPGDGARPWPADRRRRAGGGPRRPGGAAGLSRIEGGPMSERMAPSPGDILLDVRGIDAWYGRARVLEDVSLEVRRGEVVVLLGRNGAGKSTTIKAIMGLVARGDVGRIAFAGQAIDGLPPFRIARLGLGYVPEDRRVFTGLTVRENLEVGRQPPRPGVPEWNWEKLVALFPNLADMPDRPGGRMSGGEQQMLTIA